MLTQVVLAFGLTAATVVIHAFGTLGAISYFSRRWQHALSRTGFLASVQQMVRVVSTLLLLHLVEAGVWASVYLLAGVLPDLETSFYFSLTSYTTVGYGDVVLPADWRILGPVEAGVGILMFGWSTGIMVTALSRIYASRLQFDRDPIDVTGQSDSK